MSDLTTTSSPTTGFSTTTQWVTALPDGAVSVDTDSRSLILRASRSLQDRFEELLAKRKDGTLTPGEAVEFNAIAELDDALSWLNRLSRAASRPS